MDYTQLVSNVGFPIAMTIYLMTRFEKKLGENTKALDKLHEVIQNDRTCRK
jgi:hypothetical protein